MLNKITVFAMVNLALIFGNAFGRPQSLADFGKDFLSVCYSLNCPESTYICGKHSEVSSEDRTKLNVQIRCYDEDGFILKSQNDTEENPYGPGVYYKGTKLSAVLKISPTYVYSIENDTDHNDKESNPAGLKSEVEDLNSR